MAGRSRSTFQASGLSVDARHKVSFNFCPSVLAYDYFITHLDCITERISDENDPVGSCLAIGS